MSNKNQAVDTAKTYYDSQDADNFYFHIWGGEDIHIGLYEEDEEPIREASRRTVEKMASKLTGLKEGTVVADLGSGYGGAARYLTGTFDCRVECINISPVENERNRQMNRKANLDASINVTDASFEEIPLPDSSCDFAWSQDAILHSGNRKKVLEEVYRILKPGGEFIFTDPMQKDGVNRNDIQAVLDRIHLSDLGSFEFYKKTATELGMEIVEVENLSEYLPIHYGRVHDEIVKEYDTISKHCSPEYLERMKTGLKNWVNSGKDGKLTWGIMHFRKK